MLHIANSINRLGAIACLVAVGCSKSASAPAPAPRTSEAAAPTPVADLRPNAATEYASIHEAMGKGFFDALADVGRDSPPTGSAADYLISKQDIVNRLIKASKIERCDFETDFNQGVDVLVPHLAWMRHFTQLLQFDAHRLVEAPGGRRAAVERLAALFRVARQAGHEPLVLAKLVSAACIDMGLQSTTSWNSQLNDPDSRAALRTELQAIKASDALDGKGALHKELELLKVSLSKNDTIDIEGAKITVSQGEKDAILLELERVLHDVDAAWGEPDAESKMKAAQDSIRNPKARAMIVNCGMFYKQLHRAQGRLDSVLADLQK